MIKFKSETSKKIASNTSYQLIGKVFSMSITILATIIITRTFGKNGFGEFNLMQVYPALFFVIVDFGINAIASKELATNWDKAQKYISNILLIRIVLSLLLIALVGIVVTFFPYNSSLRFGIYLSLLLILTQSLFATTNIIFQVKLRYDYSTVGTVLGYLLIFVAVVTLSVLNVSIVWVNFSYVVGGILTFLVNLFFLRKLGIRFELSYDKEIWKKLFAQAWPIGLMFVFSQINFKSDAILLSVMNLPQNYGLTNTQSVAVYGLPYKIFEVSLVVPTFFMNSAYPIFVRHMHESKQKITQTLTKSLIFLVSVGLFVGVCGILFAPLMIRILGGAEFGESILVLRLLLGGVFLFYLSQPLAWLLVTLEKQMYLPAIYFFGAVINLTLNAIFIPKYSFYASSVITWVSEAIILLLLVAALAKAWKQKYA